MRFFLIIVLFLVACNKEQKLVNRLEGKWKVDKILLPNGSFRSSDSVFTFTKGKVKTQSQLPVTISWNANSIISSYSIENKKDILEITVSTNGIDNIFKVQDQDDENIYAYSSLDYAIYFFKRVN